MFSSYSKSFIKIIGNEIFAYKEQNIVNSRDMTPAESENDPG